MFDPFSGWLFDRGTVSHPGDATSPPYDVISAAERDDLLDRSPYNIVRLLLPGLEPDDYRRAGSLLNEWRKDGVLIRDDTPRFYLYAIDYTGPRGERRRARGVIGALELVPLGRRVVPHEETMGKHREDRMAILDATRANLDPIIGLSAAPGLARMMELPPSAPRLQFTEPDGSLHRLYDITDPAAINAIAAAIDEHPVSIADGHHRYTTALEYRRFRDEQDGPGPWGSILTLLAPAEGSGLTIGPYHRLLPAFVIDEQRLEDAFDMTPAPPAVPTIPGSLVVVAAGTSTMLVPRSEALAALPEPWRAAGAAVAAELLYPRLGISEKDARYVSDATEAVAAVAADTVTAVLVSPVTEEAVGAAGELGIRFPTKTTYFTPKPRAGLVVRCFRGSE